MSDDKIHVPSTDYENVSRVVFNSETGVLLVKTGAMSATDNANEHLLPELEEDEDFYSNVTNGYVGGVHRLKISAFSEDMYEVMAFVDKIETNSNGQMTVNIDSSSSVNPSIRFCEKHGELQAVLTLRNEL